MKITTYYHFFTPGLCGMSFHIEPKCTDIYKELNIIPDQIESWSKRKESWCHCGTDKYKGMYDITTKSGKQYTIVEHPIRLMRSNK